MKVVFSQKATKQFLKLDKTIQTNIQKFVQRLENLDNPKTCGKSLVGNLIGFWRYRVGDYRLLCRFENNNLVITVVEVGHRREIYDK